MAAFVTTAGAAVLWMAKELIAFAIEYRAGQRRRHEAVLRFYVDALLRVENCKTLSAPEHSEFLLSVLRQHASSGLPFRLYGVHTDDRSAYIKIEEQLHMLGERASIAVRRFIVTDDLFVAQYGKMSSEEFSQLSLTRQMAVTADLFESAGDVIRHGNTAIFEIECLPHFSRLSAIRKRAET